MSDRVYTVFSARQHNAIYAIARPSVCLSVCPVRNTDGTAENGKVKKHETFTIE